MPLLALFRLAFASPPGVPPLGLPHTLTRRLILQKARRQNAFAPLRPVVGIRFQILFHSPRRGSFHLSLTVLLRYRSSSVFSLGRWTSQLPAGLACPAVLRIPLPVFPLHLPDCHRLWWAFPDPSTSVQQDLWGPTTPPYMYDGLGFSAFARHYSQNPLFSSGY